MIIKDERYSPRKDEIKIQKIEGKELDEIKCKIGNGQLPPKPVNNRTNTKFFKNKPVSLNLNYEANSQLDKEVGVNNPNQNQNQRGSSRKLRRSETIKME